MCETLHNEKHLSACISQKSVSCICPANQLSSLVDFRLSDFSAKFKMLSLNLASVFRYDDHVLRASILTIDSSFLVTETTDTEFPEPNRPITVIREKTDLKHFQEVILTWIIEQHREYRDAKKNTIAMLDRELPVTVSLDMHIYRPDEEDWEKTTFVKLVNCCHKVALLLATEEL